MLKAALINASESDNYQHNADERRPIHNRPSKSENREKAITQI